MYFAHPHSPWERGTNENTNRLLRQYFPKKTKANYSLAYLADCRQKINTRPRKCLNFASPAQHFFPLPQTFTGGLQLKVEFATPNYFRLIL
ncbi:MAG: transposase [bacterium]